MFSMAPVERSSSTCTVWPCSTSRSLRCEPMKPAPPVIRNRMGSSRRWKGLAASSHQGSPEAAEDEDGDRTPQERENRVIGQAEGMHVCER